MREPEATGSIASNERPTRAHNLAEHPRAAPAEAEVTGTSGEQRFIGRRADPAVASIGLMLAFAFWSQARHLPSSSYEPMGPGGFPLVLALGTAFLSLLLLLKGILAGHRRRPNVEPASSVAGKRRAATAGSLALTVLYGVALDRAWTSLLVATTLYLIAVGAILVGTERRSLALVAVIGLAGGLAIHVLFKLVFAIDLP